MIRAQHGPQQRRRRRLHRRRHTSSSTTASRDNGQYGFSAYGRTASTTSSLRHNEIAGNNTDDWEMRSSRAAAARAAGSSGPPRRPVVTDNWVHDNHGVGLWADTNNTGFLFPGNYIADNDAEGMIYEISYNARSSHNTFVRNALGQRSDQRGFPTAALYISESGSDPGPATRVRHTFEIAHNRFIDNWAGHHGLGERRPVRRLAGQHQHRLHHAGQPEVATVDELQRPRP